MNDGNIFGICNLLQRDEKCMQNSSQRKLKKQAYKRKLEENIKTDLKNTGQGNGLD
jgi:hypothetical protein